MTLDSKAGKIGVCILTYNSAEIVRRCIENARAALAGQPYEIVVVDNASSDESAAYARAAGDDVMVIVNSRNLGYGPGNNVGSRYLESRGCSYLAVLNPDVTLRPNTLTLMREVLVTAPQAGCVGGLASANGKMSPAFRNKPGFADLLILNSTLRNLPVIQLMIAKLVERHMAAHYISTTPGSEPLPVYAVSGACILLRMSDFMAIGGFDENIFLYMEEFVISERLHDRNLLVYGAPSAIYDHSGGHSANQVPLRIYYAYLLSEFYTCRTYFKWSFHQAFALKSIRYIELLVYAMFLSVVRCIRRLANR